MEGERGKIVKDEWGKKKENIGHLRKMQQRLSSCSVSLRRWSKDLNVIREGAIKENSEKLRELEEEEGPENMRDIKRLKGELGLLLEKEDLR